LILEADHQQWGDSIVMVESAHFDSLVVGSGEGGKYLAWHLARQGGNVAVVERRWIGGSCPNVACLPSKNEIESAHVAVVARNAGLYGVTTGPVSVDMARVRAHKREMVDRLIALNRKNYVESGAKLIMGEARLVGGRSVEVDLNDGGSIRLSADRLFLNLGTHAAIPNVPGLADSCPLTHIGALELDYVPEHLTVIGGGYVGLELAQTFRRFGARVTIFEAGARLASREDPDVAEALAAAMRDEGIDVRLGARIEKVSGRSGDKVVLEVEAAGSWNRFEGTDILVATGRIPNTANIGLKEAGVEVDARGFIVVNDRLETTAPDVWAIGEVAGSPQFTHACFDDFRVIRDNLAGIARSTKGRLVPYALFTDPPLGRVGINEAEAARRGIKIRTAKLPMESVPRAQTLSETRGFMKAIVAADNDAILGFAILGAEASEVVAIVQMAMLANLPYTMVRDAIISHPTIAEGLVFLLSRIPRA
jgi:pyruvate/2-oxoglutarate dehydrogenase complex dihydrolipoamide dehydrogenase (E3) component